MSEKKRAANRQNALKSTGPKTPMGKAASAKNSLRHGILGVNPVLVDVEDHNDWAQHLKGFFESLAPRGYLEELLTTRLAVISWRQARIVRYEVEVGGTSLARASADAEEARSNNSRKPGPELAPMEALNASMALYTLGDAHNSILPDETKVKPEAARSALRELSLRLAAGGPHVKIPGVPDDQLEFSLFDQWTLGLIRKAIKSYATAAKKSPNDLIFASLLSACAKNDRAQRDKHDATVKRERWELFLNRENSRRLLLEPDVLSKIARYESNLERSFFRTLHELQRIQAARHGTTVDPPAVVDVDL